ncbi:mycofactocin-coupled SDR family oxidoreductase [Gordonia otitidis]|uniref:Oxidoreductase n=1 Tax=Gordonia otitidis (strain DSM 44809 / CCUG 52243 / JCM 12355 / NBRC 100426 / IFM 10032) TaxID=1108044 RepID=H5TN99_GORO1|nr:mycofactocin-coupled SDR family oxidoreductase [Gordonia otitidis]UEA60350.1 mycofactocin-coupled SDR family oxidoreductase [Gordonia otitidis]GAB34957.1 putative oxidoreductase [Gordonia otitidis NBRC 100426]
MGLLDDRVALITGAARGQGRAHAVTSAREGADVVLVDIDTQISTVSYPLADADDMAETVRLVEALGRKAVAITADVREQSQLDAAVATAITELGHIDILIANAGIWTRELFYEMTEQMWRDMIDVNLSGVWRSAKAVAPHMIERQTGSIVITSSVNGIEPGPTYAHYTSAKHGVLGLMKNIALELAPHGVRCNAVCPGAVLTPMVDQPDTWNIFAGGSGGTHEQMMEGGHHYGALKATTFLPPEAIADTALYLNSDLAASVTGVTIPVEAGHLLLTGVNLAPTR